MRYERHGFKENFSNANGFDDKAQVLNILLFEWAQLIKYNTFEVIEALKQAGVNVPENPSHKELVGLVVDNIDKNVKLNTRMSQLVAIRNGLLQAKNDKSLAFAVERTLNSSGPGGSAMNTAQDLLSKVGGGAAGGASAGPAGAIVGSIAGATDSVFGWMKSKKDAEIAKQQSKQSMLEFIMGKKGKGLSTGAIIGIFGGVALVFGLLIWYATKD